MTQPIRVTAEDLSLIVDGKRASLVVTRGAPHPTLPDFLDIEMDVALLQALKQQIDKTIRALPPQAAIPA
ncbi:hypothetical protein [Plastoroseomonas hellenica]|uniref:hypothetical protein n=1 Tax=Plastoroseomonas hellenica TaxID=2687306 RepID=UPI001BA7A03A|nr:hypothetical protein [Plastoroseomonas hellenica]MBR0647857.1 hypothetical protein [Plastoroseomonas hellenica]